MHRYFAIVAAAVLATGCEELNGDDTATDTGVAPTPISADGIQVQCDAMASTVTLTADVAGAPADVLLTAADFANAGFLQEEHNFAFDAGAIQPLTLDLVDFGSEVSGTSTAFNCADHFDMTSTPMAYIVRAYDDTDTLADCSAGGEGDTDAQAYLDDMGMSAGNGMVSAPEEFASCDTDLVITY